MRCSFTFGQIEALLAEMHHIASDKRVAFQGRLKHLQRWGFPSGQRPGKGKAIKYSASHVFRAVLALELIQSGINPKLAVDIINFNWNGIEGTVYMNCYSPLERRELLPDEDEQYYEDYSWIVRPEALLALTEQGEGEYDHCDAITAVQDSEILKFIGFDVIGLSPVQGAHWRNLILSGGPLVRSVLHLIEDRFEWATIDAVRCDIRDAAVAHGERLKELLGHPLFASENGNDLDPET